MVAKEVFVKYHSFNPSWVQHACKKSTVIQVIKGTTSQGIL
jgi:hypothetical protein